MMDGPIEGFYDDYVPVVEQEVDGGTMRRVPVRKCTFTGSDELSEAVKKEIGSEKCSHRFIQAYVKAELPDGGAFAGYRCSDCCEEFSSDEVDVKVVGTPGSVSAFAAKDHYLNLPEGGDPGKAVEHEWNECPSCGCDDCTGGMICKNLTYVREAKEKAMDDHGHHEPGGSTPSQYALPTGATELQDLIEYRGMSFSLGNIFKACYRLGHCDHSSTMRDLNKMKWFIERMIEQEKK